MRQKVENFFLWKWLLYAERFVIILCAVAVIVLIGTGVVCRYILHINFTSKDELLVIFALWLYFVGGMEGGNYLDNHIKADVMSVFVHNEKAERILNVIVKLISLAVSILLAVWAWQYFQLCLRLGGDTRVLHLPMMCSRGALVVGYMIPVIYNVYHMCIAVADLLHPRSPDPVLSDRTVPEAELTGGDAA